jgi:hypothetical protein
MDLGNRVAYFTFGSAFLLLSDHHNGAVGVPHDRVRDASHERASYPAEAPASYHDQVRARLLGQADDLLVRMPHPQVGVREGSPGRPDLVDLFLE